MKGRTFIREEIYICGGYVDGAIYPVFQPAGKRRKRCRPTSEVQQRLNQRNSEKRLCRLINANFGEKDMVLHLTYREDPAPEEAKRLIRNFILRLKRKMKKAGKDLKYILCTEVGKLRGRIHHHLIINGGLSRDEVEELWGLGYANSKRLQMDEYNGASALAKYLCKGEGRISYKRYQHSRNISVPEPVVLDGNMTVTEEEELASEIEEGCAYTAFAELYSGLEPGDIGVYRNNFNRGAYITWDARGDALGIAMGGKI